MANMFAKSILEKYGWKAGAGLGKDENGISEPIKVSLKNTKSGLGHIPGRDLTRNWWNKMYDDAAKKISVGTNKGESHKQEEEKIEENTPTSALYSNFLQGSTQYSRNDKVKEQPEIEPAKEDLKSLPPVLTDEQLFEICGRRTAHKAARHGLKLNGKLQRIKEQEQRYLESLQASNQHKNQILNDRIPCSLDINSKTVMTKKQQINPADDDGGDNGDGGGGGDDGDGDIACSEHEILIKKKKKKKKKDKKKSNKVTDVNYSVDDGHSGDSEKCPRKKRHLKETIADLGDKTVDDTAHYGDVTNNVQRLKHKTKKYKKRKYNTELE